MHVGYVNSEFTYCVLLATSKIFECRNEFGIWSYGLARSPGKHVEHGLRQKYLWCSIRNEKNYIWIPQHFWGVSKFKTHHIANKKNICQISTVGTLVLHGFATTCLKLIRYFSTFRMGSPALPGGNDTCTFSTLTYDSGNFIPP